MSFLLFIGAQAIASCRPNGRVDVSGSVTIQGLVVNGQSVVVTKKPNQVVLFPGGKIIINEQTSSVNENPGDINVTPIHILDGLWFDTIVGLNNDNTCAGCHSPTHGFGDTQSIAIGIDNAPIDRYARGE